MKINKYTIQERFFLFAAITMMGAYFYQFYFFYQHDKQVDEVLQKNNEVTSSYVQHNRELQLENVLLKQAIDHWKAMYEGSRTSNYQLEQQIEVVSQYWKEEYVKVSDELFDIKNKDVKISK